jgi:anti-sigma factor RsiW
MKCKQVQEQFLGLASASPAIDEHIRGCAECAQKLAEFRQTMSLLDEWKSPEVSPYFDARLQARLREVEEPRTLGAWLRDAISPFTATGRRVALGIAMVLLLGVGVALFEPSHPVQIANQTSEPPRVAKTGTAVSDLQALDKNADMFENFAMLDDMSNKEQ